MYCTNCGKEIADKAYVCPHCGVKVSGNNNIVNEDSGGPLWVFLGFLCPLIIGIVLYFALNDSMPIRMKSFIKGVIIQLVVIGVLTLLAIILWIVLVMTAVGAGIAAAY